MRDRELYETAQRCGLHPQWIDAHGKRRGVSPESLRALLVAMQADAASAHAGEHVPHLVTTAARRPRFMLPRHLGHELERVRVEFELGGTQGYAAKVARDGSVRLDSDLPPGYHTLEVRGARLTLAAAPARCFGVIDSVGETDARSWGLAVQLYGLRAPRDIGVGNFGALAELARSAARDGAAAIAISPVHAMFAADPGKFSPYSPSNRCFLNVLLADALDLVGPRDFDQLTRSLRLTAEVAGLRRAKLVDWPRAAAAHRRVFEAVFERFEAGTIAGASDFAKFRRDRGAALTHHACYEALHEHLRSTGATDQSPALRDAQSSGALAFSHANTRALTLHAFLQWCAARSCAHAQSVCRSHGMAIGLIADLAVGVDPGGSECWMRPRDMLAGATIGAPPDMLNAIGQNWGLTTFSPLALAREGFAPFLDILRASMRHAGGVRIDHVMSMLRLWLVPSGAQPRDGAYLSYPADDLLRLVALESWRHRCIVIGEDLGTVPAECRTRLAAAGVLGMDVLPFMQSGKDFTAPARWRGEAVAMTSTHDLAPVAGWWSGRDLDWRGRLDLFGDSTEAAERAVRDRERTQLARMLRRARIARLSERAPPDSAVDAAIDTVARSPSPLVIVPVEDLLGAKEQPNLPGTIAQHPNWRRRYPGDAATLLGKPKIAARLRRLQRGRRKAP